MRTIKLAYFTAIVLLSFVFSSTAHAVLVLLGTDVTIVKQTVGGDGSFTFRIYQGSQFYDEFEIHTQDDVGSFDTSLLFASPSGSQTYRIVEQKADGWELQQVQCQSDNLGNTFVSLINGVSLSLSSFGHVTCTFTNAPPAEAHTPVLIVPGVLGNDMYKGGDKLWLDLGRNFTDVGDQFMDPLQFKNDLTPLDTSLTLGELILNPAAGQHFYDLLIQEFIAQGYEEGVDLFTFPYDWRYGVSPSNVQALQEKIDAIRGSGVADVVAHSTGGLLVKKLVMDHPTQHHIGKAVMVGVPHTGAPKAVKVLLSGDGFGIPWLADAEMKKIGQNLPVVYDLAPSEKYFTDKGSYFRTIKQKLLAKDEVRNLTHAETWDFLVAERGTNAQAHANSTALHTAAFDSYDMRTAGVDAYNLVGCKSGTIGKVIEKTGLGGSPITYLKPIEVPGDGTVPLESATSMPVDSSKRYFALSAQHAKMLSSDGVRQHIVNLVAGTSLPTNGKVTSDIGECVLKGKAIAIYSPLSIQVTDKEGNALGLATDGSVVNDIPGADFNLFGEHKFLYLPDSGAPFEIHFQGTGEGPASIVLEEISNNTTTSAQSFLQLPVTPAVKAQLLTSTTQARLLWDNDGDGQADQTLLPDAVLAGAETHDILAPVTTSYVSGKEGSPGFYKSEVEVSLQVLDPSDETGESAPSGVFQTWWSIDGEGWNDYDGTLKLTSEGSHTVRYFSMDNAGNAEAEQTLEFTIDTTAPRFEVKFDPDQEKFIFTTDLDSTITCSRIVCTAQDEAGNTATLEFKQVLLRNLKTIGFSSLSLNGQKQSLSKNLLSVNLLGNRFNQLLIVRGQELARVEYDSRRNQSKVWEVAKDEKPAFSTWAGEKLIATHIDSTGISSDIH